MEIYSRLGVPPLINAAGHLTRYGGSLPSPEVLSAMAQSLNCYVELPVLQRTVHERLASLTGAESAYVTSGAAAGLYLLSVQALRLRVGGRVTGATLRDLTRDFEIAIPPGNLSPFTVAIEQTGLRLRELVDIDDVAALTPRCLFVLITLDRLHDQQLLEAVLSRARLTGAHVVIDAAAQIPPVGNLRTLPSTGADAVVFSGGKALRGPQTSGLILGRNTMVGSIGTWAFPAEGIGRPFKVGRDVLIGLLVAVEQALQQDEAVFVRRCERIVEYLVDRFADHELLQVTREYPNIAGQPVPFTLIRARGGASLSELEAALGSGDPAIVFGHGLRGDQDAEPGLIVNPLSLADGDAESIAAALERWCAASMSRGVRP